MADVTFLSSTLVLTVLCYILGTEGKAFVRLCYFTNWSNGRQSPYARFQISDIDPSLCTHLVYAFAKLDPDTHAIVPFYGDEDPRPRQEGRYREFNNLKKHYPHLKTLISIGGEFAGSEAFMSVAGSEQRLARFGTTTIDFLRKRGFDGLDVDWEYPNATTRDSFSKLLKTLRTAFEEEKGRNERLILTAALAAGSQHFDGYEVAALTKYLDYANLMTYDYHNAGWQDITGFNSPLFSRKSDRDFSQELSTNWTTQYFLSKGFPAEKILVGVTGAGSYFKLESENNTGVGAPAIKPDSPRKSDLWQMDNRLVYPEMCRVLQSTFVKYVFDEEQQVPYAFLGNNWYGYEDPRSLKGKVEWMLKLGLGGAMFWSLDQDDFKGELCYDGKYPLLRALSSKIGTIEDAHLTDNVNPIIRYLTKYTGGASAAGMVGNGSSKDSALVSVVLMVLVVLGMH